MNPAPRVRPAFVPTLVVIVAVLLAAPRPALADGAPVCIVNGEQVLPVLVPDGTGGVIIAWHDRRPTVAAAGVIFAQRVNPQGIAQWTEGGVQLSTTGDANPPVIAADGAGGAYVAFGGDASSPRAQWVNASGVVQWGADGTALTSGSSSQRELAITRDIGGAGGAIVAWREGNGNSGTSDIHAQKINSGGVIQWSPAGQVVVSTSMNSETLPAILSDNLGGAFVIWLGNGARAQRLDAAGVQQWGNTILATTANNRPPVIASDGAAGFVAAWAGGGVFAQRVTPIGNRLWNPTNTGVQMSTLGNQVTMIPDGAGGGIFTWQENRSGTNFNIYAQKLNGTGAAQWLSTGAEVCVTSGDQFAPTIAPDGSGGAFISWYDLRPSAAQSDIFAQRLDATSAPQWEADGIAVCAAGGAQEFPTTVLSASNLFIAWDDRRSGNQDDIYVNRVSPGGELLDVPADGGGLAVSAPWPHPFTDHVSFTLRLPHAMRLGLDVFDVNGRRVRSFGTRELPAGPRSLTWDGRADDGGRSAAGIYFLRVAGEGLSAIRSVVRLQ